MNRQIVYMSVLVWVCLFGCKNKPQEEVAEEQSRIEHQNAVTEVKVQKARFDHFELELASNGKAVARTKAALAFPMTEIIDSVYVNNGSRVKKGDPLLSVDGYKAEEAFKDAKMNMEKMKLELLNRLMSEGINELKDTALLPAQRLHTIMLQCGYSSAVSALEKAQKEYENIIIRAPFSGVVADMEARPYNLSSAYKCVCTLIDDSKMEVVFHVLETEIRFVHPGMEVELTPYASSGIVLHGEVTEVNPRIDENGMVRLKAMVNNKERALVDGMNVNIVLKRKVDSKLIVPKSAVLPRQGKKVVFIHINGKAIWRYVTTSIENSREICIESGLKEGDEVIYDNNLGLSHESEVSVRN